MHFSVNYSTNTIHHKGKRKENLHHGVVKYPIPFKVNLDLPHHFKSHSELVFSVNPGCLPFLSCQVIKGLSDYFFQMLDVDIVIYHCSFKVFNLVSG